jgi:hypothetical protein
VYHDGGGEAKVGTAAAIIIIEWLGHLAWMPDHLVPKSALFQARPIDVAQRKGGEIKI